MIKKTKSFLDYLNPINKCRKWDISLWQCPQFLFILMGLIIIVAILVTYFIAIYKIGNPEVVSLLVLSVAFVLVILDYIITRSFERLAEISRMKTEFISIVSHQLRSPLTNLSWVIDFIASGEAGAIQAKQIEYFKILKTNTSRMRDLVNNLLTVSRIEMRRLPIDKSKEVLLGDLTKKVVAKFQPLIKASNVEISLDIQKDLPKIPADSLWLEQAVSNLLDNAIRYITKEGKISIRIYQKKQEVYFEIKDNGVGISVDEQKFIFQKFFRCQNAIKYQTGGSGLGLYITKQVLNMMGGKIWFKSKEGQGTTFYFSLPLKNK